MNDTVTISKIEYEEIRRKLREFEDYKVQKKRARRAKIEEQMQEGKGRAQDLFALAGIIPKGSGVPTDLAQNHDKYLWEE